MNASRRAMTLLEMMAAVLILSIAATAALPVIDAASRTYTETARTRTETARLRYAVDRITRVLRQTPVGEVVGTLGIERFGDGVIEFTDGTGVELDGVTLLLLDGDLGDAILLEGVSIFEIIPLADDGSTTLAPAAAAEADRFRVHLATPAAELRTIVYPRVRMTQ